MRILFFSLFVVLFLAGNFRANLPSKKSVDSLAQILSKTKNGQKRVDILNKISRLQRDRGERKSSLTYAQSAKTAATELNYDQGKIDALLNIGTTERELGNYQQALISLNELIKLSNKTRNLIAKGDAFDNIGHVFFAENKIEQSLKFHLSALALRKQMRDDYGCGNSCDNIALIYYLQNNYLLASNYYKQSFAIFERLKDDSRVALSAANLGMLYSNTNSYSEALKHHAIALEKYQKLNNQEGLYWVNNMMGEIYSRTEIHEKALDYFQKAFEIGEKLQNPKAIAESYGNIGLYYSEHDRLNTALKYYFKQLEIGTKYNDNFIVATANYDIGRVKSLQKKLDEAVKYLQIAEQTASKDSLLSTKYASIGLMGKIYYDQNQYGIAKDYNEKALAYHQLSGEKNHLATDYLNLAYINERMNDHQSALANYKLHALYKDSLKQDDISKTVMRYEFEKKETQIKNQQQEELKNKNKISNIIYGILCFVIVSTIFVLYIFRLRNKKLSAEKQNLELKHREAELAKETEEFKSRFLSNISHEFRTPLTLINGHLEILQKTADPKNMERYTEMEYSGQRLLQLINQLLDLTPLEKNKYKLYYKKGNLLTESLNYIQSFQSLATQRQIELTTEITETAKNKFLKQDFAYSSETVVSVFNNLISNALKFTPVGGTVRSTIDFKENKIFLSVSDNGYGIPDEALPKIFDRFYQVVTKEKPVYQGSGIGLAIVKELAILHGGDAEVTNNKRGGCTFTVWLAEGETLSSSDETDTKIPTINPTKSVDEAVSQSEEKPILLVVEDQYELRKFIVENIGGDFRFIEAENGKQGTELALEHLPDVIISDVMMPEMNGFQLCKNLKENEITSHIPIILLTAKSDLKDKIEGLETGAEDYVTKPFSISELALRVKNQIRLQENLRKKFVGTLIPVVEDAPELNQRDRHFLEKLDKIARENLENDPTVSFLATEIGLSTSQLTRKLKTLTGETPASFIKNIQMEMAIVMLKNGDSVSEAAWKTGFSEPAYFTKVFKKHFGFLPSDKEKLFLVKA